MWYLVNNVYKPQIHRVRAERNTKTSLHVTQQKASQVHGSASGGAQHDQQLLMETLAALHRVTLD